MYCAIKLEGTRINKAMITLPILVLLSNIFVVIQRELVMIELVALSPYFSGQETLMTYAGDRIQIHEGARSIVYYIL